MPKPVKHILVIRLSAMGDVAMTVPVIRAVIQQHPELRITVLTREFFSPFFRDLKNVSVFPVDVKGKHKGFLGLYRLARSLKLENVEAVADLHNVLRSNILKFFLLGKCFIQIDKGRKDKKALVSGKLFKPLKTTHQRYVDVFEKLGFKVDLSYPNFPGPYPIYERMEHIIESHGKRNKKWIGIAPFATYESKIYPLVLMREVIEELSKKYKIFLFGGGENEIVQLKKIADSHKNVTNLAGKLHLDSELNVISNLDVMLSMDSGNAHIAAMLGVKVVTIWGVTHPYAGFMPFNQPEDYALVADREKFPKIPTSIYGNKYPENYKEAPGSISPETIVNKIKSIL